MKTRIHIVFIMAGVAILGLTFKAMVQIPLWLISRGIIKTLGDK